MGKIYQAIVRAYPRKTTFRAMRGRPSWFRWKAATTKDTTVELPLVPVVLSSVVTAAQPDGIMVHWDRPMMMTCDAKAQITVLADGNPVVVHSIEFHPTDPSMMGIIVGGDFTPGQVVTWAYDDSGPCDLQEIALPQTEADNQTYSVDNLLQHSAPIPTSQQFKTSAGKPFVTSDNENFKVKL